MCLKLLILLCSVKFQHEERLGLELISRTFNLPQFFAAINVGQEVLTLGSTQ